MELHKILVHKKKKKTIDISIILTAQTNKTEHHNTNK